jgi:hypothetical protein
MLPEWDEVQPYLRPPFSEKNIRVDKPAAIDPPHLDPRLAVQGSHFVIFGRTQEMTRMRAVKKKNCRLARITVTRGGIKSIQEELAVLGITWGQLFPDLEGLCKDIRRRWARSSASRKLRA